jgi:hypothetical protein
MKHIIVTGTITYAMRGRDILRKNGYNAIVERNSSGLGRLGCGYGIAIYDNLGNAVELLRENGIKIIDVNTLK